MKIIKKSEVNIFKNSDKCIVWEYPLSIKELNGALIKIGKRYPDKGNVVNDVCKEIVYVVDGNGKVAVEGIEHDISAGDVVFIDHNEKFHWEGNIAIFTVCTPAYYPEQHKEVL